MRRFFPCVTLFLALIWIFWWFKWGKSGLEDG